MIGTGGVPPEASTEPQRNSVSCPGRQDTEALHLKRAVCVAKPASGGRPVRLTGDEPAEFLDCIKEASIAWVNFTLKDLSPSAEKIISDFGFSPALYSALMHLVETGAISGYEDLDTELGILLPSVRVSALTVASHPLFVLVKNGLVLTIHGSEVQRFVRFARYADAFMRKIPQEAPPSDKITLLLYRVLNENNERNFDGLRSIEEQGDDMSRMLLDPEIPRSALGIEIYQMKHALIAYLNSLWASLDVVNFLRFGDPEIVTDAPRLLARFSVLAEDVSNQISLAEHMSEVLASGLEVLQSIYNNQLQLLNNKLAYAVAWITILGTAFLVPNTIATVMSNPAFRMTPDDAGWYTVLIAVSTIIATLCTFWVVMRRGWLPRKVDAMTGNVLKK